ncbi:MAG TPA: MYXO-CTERM sorting domain-containing protein, partial [Planctomycetota bacterium]|nr:MYXO-CTERM sorting domain-containing protein [Planctomycetota bacterium]
TAGGTTSWSATIPLSAGAQTITITAYDTSGNTRTDTLSVDFTTGGGGGGGGGAPPAAPADDGSGRKQCGCGAVSGGFPKGSALLLVALMALSFRRRTP